jgi:X-Pro dipeptidyl-peptidase C-terminal non-catalytic domain
MSASQRIVRDCTLRGILFHQTSQPGSALHEHGARLRALFRFSHYLHREPRTARRHDFPRPQPVAPAVPFHFGRPRNPFHRCATAQHSPPEPAVEQQNRMMADFFDRLLRPEVSTSIESGIRYYTMGEGQWHETKVWPPPGFDRASRLYFVENHALSLTKPAIAAASDIYPVNFTASTGKNNRWMTELDLDILYPDRSAEDSKLLAYTGAPLATDVEISGSPLVVLEALPQRRTAHFSPIWRTSRPMATSPTWTRENCGRSTASSWILTNLSTIRLAESPAVPVTTLSRWFPESLPN